MQEQGRNRNRTRAREEVAQERSYFYLFPLTSGLKQELVKSRCRAKQEILRSTTGAEKEQGKAEARREQDRTRSRVGIGAERSIL